MIGKRLNSLRKAQKITARQMAERLNCSIRTYRNYESETSFPDYSRLIQIADMFDVSIDYLLGRDDFLAKHADSRQ